MLYVKVFIWDFTLMWYDAIVYTGYYIIMWYQIIAQTSSTIDIIFAKLIISIFYFSLPVGVFICNLDTLVCLWSISN